MTCGLVELYRRLQDSTLDFSFLWNIKQLNFLVAYRRFGTTYRSQFQGSKSSEKELSLRSWSSGMWRPVIWLVVLRISKERSASTFRVKGSNKIDTEDKDTTILREPPSQRRRAVSWKNWLVDTIVLLLQYRHLDGGDCDPGTDIREPASAQGGAEQREAAAVGHAAETASGAAGKGLCQEARGGAAGAPGAEQDDAWHPGVVQYHPDKGDQLWGLRLNCRHTLSRQIKWHVSAAQGKVIPLQARCGPEGG